MEEGGLKARPTRACRVYAPGSALVGGRQQHHSMLRGAVWSWLTSAYPALLHQHRLVAARLHDMLEQLEQIHCRPVEDGGLRGRSGSISQHTSCGQHSGVARRGALGTYRGVQAARLHEGSPHLQWRGAKQAGGGWQGRLASEERARPGSPPGARVTPRLRLPSRLPGNTCAPLAHLHELLPGAHDPEFASSA